MDRYYISRANVDIEVMHHGNAHNFTLNLAGVEVLLCL